MDLGRSGVLGGHGARACAVTVSHGKGQQQQKLKTLGVVINHRAGEVQISSDESFFEELRVSI